MSELWPEDRIEHRLALGKHRACGGVVLLTACNIGPKYTRPSAPVPPAYKELGAPNVDRRLETSATAGRCGARRSGGKGFNDPQLNAARREAQYFKPEHCRGGGQCPCGPGHDPAKPGRSTFQRWQPIRASQIHVCRPDSGKRSALRSPTYSLPFEASWEPDLWGRIRNTVKANTFAAQASVADLENVRLSAQADLATDYYELRAQDALKQLLDSTVSAYQEALELTRDLYTAGIGNDEAVAQAEAQWKATQAQDTNLGVLRAQYEHAIALLAGQPASAFAVPVEALKASPPSIPLGVPSAASGAPSRYRRGRTRRRPGQCADRHRQDGLFPGDHVKRLCRISESLDCKMARMAEPGLVRGSEPGADDFRCGIAQGYGPAVPGILRSNRRELPANRADGLSTGRR